MILLAAHKLEDHGQSPFSAEDLIVSAWKEFPRPFGLKGYADQYPDSNRVLSAIMGERGLTRKGWLAKMGQKMYSLSKEGQRVVKRVLEGEADDEEEALPPTPPPSKVSRDQERLLLSMLDSAAVSKFSSGQGYEMTFPEAGRFWGFTEATSGETVDAKLEFAAATLKESERLTKKKMLVLSHREVTNDDVQQLREVDQYLRDRFGRHLSVLRSRR
jgi:hypothetical protein